MVELLEIEEERKRDFEEDKLVFVEITNGVRRFRTITIARKQVYREDIRSKCIEVRTERILDNPRLYYISRNLMNVNIVVKEDRKHLFFLDSKYGEASKKLWH